MILKTFQDNNTFGMPIWEVVSFIDNKGYVFCTSGKTVKLVHRLNLVSGQHILVYKNEIIKIEQKNKRIFDIRGKEKELIVMCSVGINTVDYNKKYYILDPLSGNFTETIPSGWTFIDDGLYVPEINPLSPVFYDDPYAYNYKYQGNGLKIPESPSGIASKYQSGKSLRFILNNSLEDEAFAVWLISMVIQSETIKTNFLSYENSLCTKPYKITGRPFMNRYTIDGIISIHKIVDEVNNNVLQIKYYDTNEGAFAGFGDRYVVSENVFKKTFTGITTITSILGDSGALVGANGFGNSDIQKVLRPDTFELSGRKYGEPIINEEYDVQNENYEGETDRYIRCKNTNCHVSGYPPFLNNDIKLPYTIDKNGKLTYVRMLKNDDFSLLTTEVYINDILIDSSGQEDVYHIQNYEGSNDDVINFSFQREYYATKTKYQIHQVYNDDIFSMILYSKTVLQDRTDTILDGYGIRDDNDESGAVYRYINQTALRSKTTWHVWINGKSHKVDAERNVIEYFMMLASGSENRVPVGQWGSLKRTDDFLQVFSWCETDTQNEPHLTRLFTTATKQYCLLGFDIYSLNIGHNLVHYPDSKALTASYDIINSSNPVLPWTDLQTAPDRRLWLLFDINGQYIETNTPDYNRVNGLCLLDSSDTF